MLIEELKLSDILDICSKLLENLDSSQFPSILFENDFRTNFQ